MSNFKDNTIGNPATRERRALRVGKISEVSSIVKMAPSTIRAKMRAGEFPVSTRLSYKLAVWNLYEVEAWFEEKLKAAPVYMPRPMAAIGSLEVIHG